MKNYQLFLIKIAPYTDEIIRLFQEAFKEPEIVIKFMLDFREKESFFFFFIDC